MLFNSFAFAVFLPVVFILYWAMPAKFRWAVILVASYYFYASWNAKYLLLILFITAISYFCALAIEKVKTKKIPVFIAVFSSLALLFVFKYFNFAFDILNKICKTFSINLHPITLKLLLPVGISFYTFQALSYVIDVYKNKVKAEKHFGKYAAFISFFPQLVAGPIERTENLLPQINTACKFELDNLRKGAVFILWGLFTKMVIADRCAIFVDVVYGNCDTYPGFYILIATFLFAIQIYCDFYGYSTIARGSALLFGIKLMDNFNAPYFSASVKEFWRRWHISLSTWFKDYVYIPLGGNRKGKPKQIINLLIVFGLSGLWHGAELSFIFWGLLNGTYQAVSIIFAQFINKVKQLINWQEKLPGKVVRILATFALICFAWLFFRAGSLPAAVYILKRMIAKMNFIIFFDGSIWSGTFGLNGFGYVLMLGFSIFLLFCIDYLKYKGFDVADLFLSQYVWFRVGAEIFLLFYILLFGCYGELYNAESFIYFQF